MNQLSRWLPRLAILGLAIFGLGIPAAGFAQAQGMAATEAMPQLREAEALLERGNPEQAYALLEPLEPELAGNLEYDYLFGVSALNSGRASRAVFALERVQATDSGYKNIGLWLSIAYYESGDQERAKACFETVLAQSTDTMTRDKAERYLAAIRLDEAAAEGRPSLLGRVEFGVGYDSNIVNSSPAYQTALQLAAALPAPASNQASAESILNIGAEMRIPMRGQYAFVSVDDEKRNYPGPAR